jgi:serum/glucocorticoid-regulated kinase 2
MVAQLSGGSLQLRPVFAIRPPRPVNISDFEIYRCIGVGGFSKVYVGKCNFTGEMCALKFISKDYILRNKKQRLLYNEREVLGSLHHRSLVGLHFAFETKNFVVFVL